MSYESILFLKMIESGLGPGLPGDVPQWILPVPHVDHFHFSGPEASVNLSFKAYGIAPPHGGWRGKQLLSDLNVCLFNYTSRLLAADPD